MKNHLIDRNESILSALEKLNKLSGGTMTLFAVDEKGHLLGSVTDGDIRRGLLGGATPEQAVSSVMHRGCRSLCGPDVDIRKLRELRTHGVKLIPVIDSNGIVCRIIDTSVASTCLPLSAILMAGGKGERLRPLTTDTPKPLLKVGNRPIIDRNISLLADAGISNVYVTVNYLAHKIERHFETPVAGIAVKTLREPMPLGTIGSASLAPIPEVGDTLVMNSDLLTDISLEEMYLAHTAAEADITIAAVSYTLSVPYAILETDGNKVTALEEKPSYTYYANAGIYIISNRLLKSLPSDRRTDATDLIATTLKAGGKVTYYPISGTWIDIGSPADYRHACEIAELS